MILLSTLVSSLLLLTCGGGGGGDNAPAGKSGSKIVDPWSGVGSASLSETVTESVRVLEFDDGMGISYDGSDEGGEEEVCRRERMAGSWYEICMPLEDDPYFVTLESKAFVWHPLLFDRFSTELICRSWMEGGENKTDEDCEVVMARLGGEDFHCEAGLFNGDRALRCSDEWAVVINGDTDDTKSVCRVHTDNGRGRCLGAPKKRKVRGEDGVEREEKIPDRELILEMQRSSWSGYRSGQDNSKQYGVGESVSAVIPQDISAGAVLSYHSRDEGICTVDNDDTDGGMGDVTIAEGLILPTICKIVLRIESEGFVDRVFFAELPVLMVNDTAWADYTLSDDLFYPGETLSAGAVSSSAPPTSENSYTSADQSICTIDESGTITAVTEGECTVSLTSRAEDYLDKIIDKSVTVSPLKVYSDIVWTLPIDGLVGVDTTAIDAPVVKDADGNDVSDSSLVVAVNHISGDCSYDDSSRVLSFADATECILSVSASGVRGHAEYVKEFKTTPTPGALGLTWAGYTSLAPKLSDTPPALTAPTVTSPADGNGVTYAYISGGTVCDVDAASGALTLKSVGSCSVRVTASRSGYNDASVNVSVVVGQGDQTLTVPTNPYGGVTHLGASRRLSLESFPMGGYGVLVFKSKNTGDDCIVAAISDTNNKAGDIIAGSGGTGTCTIQAQWSGNFQYAPSAWTDIATINMVANAQTFAWESDPYGANPTMKVNEVLNIVNASKGGTGGIEYKSPVTALCTVAADGAVTGTGVGDCTIVARWKGDSSNGASDWVTIPGNIAVTRGVAPTDLSASDAYGASAAVAVGETLELVAAPAGYGTVSYRTKAGSETYCSVEATTGTVTALALGDCTVEAGLGGTTDYAPSVALLQTIGVTEGRQVITLSEPYGAIPTVAVGETLEIVTAPTAAAGADAGGDISYRVKSGSEAHCSVDAATGEVTATAVGNCIIEAQAAAVAPNYGISQWVEVAAIGVEEGTLAGISWTPGASRARVGEDFTLAAVNVGDSGATISYAVSDTGKTGCAFMAVDQNDAAAERTLTFTGHGRCVVVASADKDHYQGWEQEHTIIVAAGTFEIPQGAWGQFSGSLTVGGATKAPVRSEAVPAGVQIRYSLLRGERDCRLVNYRTGEVQARRVPLKRVGDQVLTKCSVLGTAHKKGHRLVKSPPVEITLSPGQILMRSLPRYVGMRINPDNTVQLPKGGSLTLEVDGHPRVVGDFPVEVSYSGQGYSAGTTEYVSANEKDVCTVDPVTGAITTEATVAVRDICRLTIAMVDPMGSHHDLETSVNFIIVEESLDFTNNPQTLSYGDGAKLKIGVTTPLTPNSLIALDDNSVPVTWTYVAEGFVAGGTTTPKKDVCRVDTRLKIERQSTLVDNPNYGKVTLGEGANNGDTCRITAYATAPGYLWYEGVTAVEFVVEGHQLLFAGGSGSLPDYSEELRVTGTAGPDTLATQDDNGVDVIWGGFQAKGRDIIGFNRNHNNVCFVDPISGVVTTGGSASPGDTCVVTAVAKAATAENYDDSAPIEVANYNIRGTGTFFTIKGPGYDPNGLLVGGEPLSFTTEPSVTNGNMVAELIWTYTSEGKRNSLVDPNLDICTVDEKTGVVSPGADAESGDTCEIVATASANGYTEKSASAVALTVKVTFDSLAWDTFPDSGTVGVSINLSSNQPVSDPVAGGYAVGIDSGDCSYDDGVLTFSDTTECVVSVTANKDGYVPLTETFRVTPTAGAITLAGADETTKWGSYAPLTVGGDPVSAPGITPTPSDVEKAYTTLTETVCSVTPNLGAVAGLDDDTCRIKLVLSRSGYADLEYTYSFDVGQGTLPNITWGSFQGGSLVVGGGNRTPTVPTGVSGATFAYALKQGSEANCTLEDTATGEVSALAVDLSTSKECTIIGTASKTGYADATSGDITVALSKGTQPAITWGQFSGTLKVGGGTKTPATTSATGATITYALKAGNTNCTLENAATGEVSALAVDFSSTKTCTIVGTATRTGYNDETSGDISINLTEGTQGTITWGSFSGTLSVGGGVKSPSAPTGAGAGSATITYALKAGSSSNCSLTDANAGSVSALAVDLSSTKTCTIIGTATRTGYTAVTSGDISIDLSWGTQPTITWGNFGSNTLVVGGSTQTPTTTTATGATIAYALKSGSETNCDLVTASSGEVRAKAVDLSTTKACIVIGTATRTGYTAAISGDISINLAKGTMGALTAPGYGANTLAIGGSSSVAREPGGAPDGASWTYAVTSGTCTILGNTGVISALSSAGSGDTCVVTATASATGYNDKAAPTVTLTVTSDRPLTITWGGYTSGTATWASGGVTEPTLSAPTVADSDSNGVTAPAISFTYSVGDSTTNSACSVDTGTGAITINGAGICHILLTVADAAGGDNINYITQTASARVTIAKGSQTLSATDPYGTTAPTTLKVGAEDIAITNAPTGGQGSLIYTSSDTAVCTVSDTGTIASVTPGSCVVKASWSGNNNFLASPEVTLLTLTIGKGTITITGGYPNWGSYPTITVGQGSLAPTAVVTTPADAVREYASTTPTQCRITNAGTGALEGFGQWQHQLRSSTDPHQGSLHHQNRDQKCGHRSRHHCRGRQQLGQLRFRDGGRGCRFRSEYRSHHSGGGGQGVHFRRLLRCRYGRSGDGSR